MEKETPEYQEFKQEDFEVPKEKMRYYNKGKEDGRALMKNIFERRNSWGKKEERIRNYSPTGETINKYREMSGLNFNSVEDRIIYARAFNQACEQGWPPLDL